MPIALLPKKDDLSGFVVITVSLELQVQQYPLPFIEDIFVKLAGRQKFSKIDVRQAYHKSKMEEDSRK